MKLLHLEYFVSVCRLGSTLQASNSLSVSQPTVSAAIRDLEKEFGVLLFERNGKRLEITPAGKQLYQLAVSLLEMADNTAQIMTDLAKKRNRVRLGITPMLACLLLPKLYTDFRHNYPDVNLCVTEAGAVELHQKLQAKEIDMLISSFNDELEADCHTLELMKLRYGICVRADHPLASRETVSFYDLKEEPLACFTMGFHQNQFIERRFAEIGAKPNIVFRTSQIATMWEMVRHGVFSCIMYMALQSQCPDLRFIPFSTETSLASVPIRLSWRKNDYVYSDMEKLIHCIKAMRLD